MTYSANFVLVNKTKFDFYLSNFVLKIINKFVVNLLNIDKRLSSTIGVGTSARHSNLMVSSTLIPHGGWNISPTAKHVAPFAPSSLQGHHHYYEAICHRHGH